MATTAIATGGWTLQGKNSALQGRLMLGALLAQADSNAGSTVPMKTWRDGVLVGQSATVGGAASPLDLACGWSGSGMGVAVYAGAWVKSRAGQGPYLGYQQVNTSFLMDPGHSVNARKDLIVAEILDSGIGDAGLLAQLYAVKGLETGANTLPAAPAGAIPLYQAQVNANVTSGASVVFTDLRKGTMLNGGVRALLGGDALADPGYRVGETRIRPASGNLPAMIDVWGHDQKWHGTRTIGLPQVNPPGGTNIGGAAVSISLGTITVADPGWEYRLGLTASIGLQIGAGTKYEVSFRDGSATGTELGSRTVWDRNGADTVFTTYYKNVEALTGVLTGGKTIHIGALRTTGGNGIDMAGAAYNTLKAEIIPA
jgi:hypothetical protein